MSGVEDERERTGIYVGVAGRGGGGGQGGQSKQSRQRREGCVQVVVDLPLTYWSHQLCPCRAILPNSLHATRCEEGKEVAAATVRTKREEGSDFPTATSCNGRE